MTELVAAQPLTIEQVMCQIYEGLAKRFDTEPNQFPEGVYTIIADDSDHHRTRRGNMLYESCVFLRISDRTWVTTLGDACGSYPADPYHRDLTVFECPEDEQSDKVKLVMDFINDNCDWWRYSILMSYSNGNLGVISNSTHKKIAELIRGKMEEFVVSPMEVNEKLISASTLSPIVTKQPSYKPEIVPFLADCIVEFLTNK